MDGNPHDGLRHSVCDNDIVHDERRQSCRWRREDLKKTIENRSLQNKMKVLQMNEEKNKSGDEAKEELLKLNEELTREKNEGLKSKERITQLQKQIDDLKAGGNVATTVVADTKALESGVRLYGRRYSDVS